MRKLLLLLIGLALIGGATTSCSRKTIIQDKTVVTKVDTTVKIPQAGLELFIDLDKPEPTTLNKAGQFVPIPIYREIPQKTNRPTTQWQVVRDTTGQAEIRYRMDSLGRLQLQVFKLAQELKLQNTLTQSSHSEVIIRQPGFFDILKWVALGFAIASVLFALLWFFTFATR